MFLIRDTYIATRDPGNRLLLRFEDAWMEEEIFFIEFILVSAPLPTEWPGSIHAL